LVAIAVLLVVALVAAGVAIRQNSAADKSASAAAVEQRLHTASRLAGRADVLPPDQHDLRLLLAVEAHRLAPSPETEGALFRAITGEPPREPVTFPDVRYVPGVSRDGSLVAAVEPSGTAHIYDVASAHEVRRFETSPDGLVIVALFSPDNEWLAVSTDRGSVTVWNVADGQRVAGPINAVGPAYGLLHPTSQPH